VFPLVHVPPDGLALSAVVEPAHTVNVPDITGIGLTVTTTAASHPALTE
jgi:hypothetical protein